jgi:membrane-bound lytic murein transglycosylase B
MLMFSIITFFFTPLFAQEGALVEEESIDTQFSKYVKELRAEAEMKGFPAELLDPAFASIKMREKVVQADKNQPETKLTLDKYLSTRVPDWKVKQAVEKMQEHAQLLDQIEKNMLFKNVLLLLYGVMKATSGAFKVIILYSPH